MFGHSDIRTFGQIFFSDIRTTDIRTKIFFGHSDNGHSDKIFFRTFGQIFFSDIRTNFFFQTFGHGHSDSEKMSECPNIFSNFFFLISKGLCQAESFIDISVQKNGKKVTPFPKMK